MYAIKIFYYSKFREEYVWKYVCNFFTREGITSFDIVSSLGPYAFFRDVRCARKMANKILTREMRRFAVKVIKLKIEHF